MPSLNEEKNVDATFAAIFASSRLPDEIVVADGGSKDATLEKVRAYAGRGPVLKIVDNKKVLPGAGRNAAVAATDCEILLLLDFGNAPDPEWIARMAAVLEENPDTDIVAGCFTPAVHSDFEHCVAVLHYFDYYNFQRFTTQELIARAPKKPIPGGTSVGYRRRAWIRAGGQPEWLRTSEDILFSRKLLAFGSKLAIAPGAVSYHHMRSRPSAFFKQIFLYSRGFSRIRVLSRHFFKLCLFAATLLLFFGAPIAQPAMSAAGVAAMLGYYVHQGPRKLILIDGRIKKASYLWMTMIIILYRDLATIGGIFAGAADYVLRPEIRTSFIRYMDGAPKGSYAVFQDK